MWLILAFGTGCSWLQTPEQRVCSKLVAACDLTARADAGDPYQDCIADVKPWLDDAKPENVESLLACVDSEPSCGKVQGCLAGAGLRSVLDDFKDLFKGFGEAFGKPKKDE